LRSRPARTANDFGPGAPIPCENDLGANIATTMFMQCLSTRAMPIVAAATVILIMGAAPTVVLGQTTSNGGTTREESLRADREQRVSESTPPTRSRVERWLYWYDHHDLLERVFKGTIGRGFHISSGGFPAGAGPTIGLAYDKTLHGGDPGRPLPNTVSVAAGGAYSRYGYKRVRAATAWEDIGGSPLHLSGFGQYYEYPQEDFFGFGMDSNEDARTSYLIDAVDTGASLQWTPGKFEFGTSASYFNPRNAAGTDDLYPSIEQGFDVSQLPGYGTETDFLRVEETIAFDWRDNPSLPKQGGRYAVTLTQYEDRDLRQFDSKRVDVSLQQYVPLPNRYRRLALRADASFTDADTGQQVPYYLLPTLGGARNLRGFREFRYRDKNSVLATAEYQWEAWWALDVALFADAGTVAPTRQLLSMRDVEVGYGVGFRFHSNKAFVGRLDLAFSKEGFIPLLRFDHVF
jgi:Omp85 superfamily domain